MKIKKKKIPYKKKKKLLDEYQNKNYDVSEKLSLSLSKKYPNDGFSWKILGLTFFETNKISDALEASKKSLVLEPKDPEILNNLGTILKKLNKKEEAINYFKQAIDLNPNFFLAHKNLGVLFHEANNPKMAMKYYEEANKILNDPEVSHLMSSLSGKAESNFSKDYAKRIFNDQASNFENLLVGKLDYKLPQTVSNLLIEKSQNNSLGSVLDLGCGTGLLGERVKKFCNYLEGVDISKSMLKEALNKKVYNKLVASDITEYLSKVDLDFDYIICLDTFVYIGDLNDIFKLIISKNHSNGKFIFSTEYNENTDSKDFILESSGRYSHTNQYIESLCKIYNYNLDYFEKVELRLERKNYIIGGLYILDF